MTEKGVNLTFYIMEHVKFHCLFKLAISSELTSVSYNQISGILLRQGVSGNFGTKSVVVRSLVSFC